jgi:hypothetical protein
MSIAPLSAYISSLGITAADLADHSSLTKSIISLNAAFIAIIILVAAIRLSIRLFMVRNAGLDDCMIAHPFGEPV